MKRCSKCGETKPTSEFSRLAKSRDGRHYHCKVCYNARHRAWHNAADNVGLKREYAARGRNRTRELLYTLKNVACADCKVKYIPYAMDFDHRPGEEKAFNLSEAISKRFSIERILNEAAKCDVVCATCHRIRTYSRRKEECHELLGSA